MNLNLIGFTIRSFNVVVTFILTVSDDTASQDGGCADVSERKHF